MKNSLAVLLFLSCLLVAQEDPKRPVATTAALDAAATAAHFKLPSGFRAELIASEPDVVQPIAYTIDDRGRLWVLENTNYPDSPGKPKDRIVVLEDADGDGSFEKSSVFWDKATFSSGIAVGFGGVWIGSPPFLLFIPNKDGDAVPDGPPQIILDGWGAEDTHETINNFTWGPDGWLYGTQGIFTHSKVGRPGSTAAERVPINAGVWRYHPTKKVFERWCEGVSNQWGVDWNDHGEMFFAACVIPHMWQGIEGAHYTRQSGAHFSPHVYENIKDIAWGRYEKAGYCGAMFYLGGAFPAQWRNNFFFFDVHMNKLRCETFDRHGSGYKAVRKTNFLDSPDAWFRGLSPQYGPDGGVFVSDWYDKVPCHQQRAFTDRSNGRFYKIVTDQVKPLKVDLSSATGAELVKMQLNPNDWHVRHARRLLQERGPQPETTIALEKILFENPDDTRQLRALWALHSQGALSEASALRALAAKSDFVRGWTITCVSETGAPSAALLSRMLELAEKDPSPSVRLRIASAVGKLAPASRWPLLTALASHTVDIEDHNLPLMTWYATEGAVAADPVRGVMLLNSTAQPRLHEYIARRVMAVSLEDEKKAAPAMNAIATTLTGADSTKRANVLRGLLAAAVGRKRLPEPSGWSVTYQALRTDKDSAVRQQARNLALLFGSATALDELRVMLADTAAPPETRREALEALVTQRDAATLDPLLALAAAPGPLRIHAVRALASYGDPRISSKLTGAYASLTPEEKSATLTTLLARATSTEALLAAFDAKTIPIKDLTAPLAQLIKSSGRADFDQWLVKNWGSMKQSSAELQAEMKRYHQFLGEDAILRADVKNGQAIFMRNCAACHNMFGQGGHIGPELPGNFADVDYLLQNILDPNAIIGRDFQQTFITTKDGGMVAGAVIQEDEQTITLKTLAAPITLPKDTIVKRELSPNSMMPVGLLNTLEEPEVRDLFLYLRQSKAP